MTATNFYSCSSSSSSSSANAAAIPLLPDGATQLSITYQYEIETSSSSSSSSTIDEAIGRIQSAMLFNIARQSGLTNCPTTINDNENENGDATDSPWRHRKHGLRGLSDGAIEGGLTPPPPSRGRGSNSMVGLSSLPADFALIDVPCHELAVAAEARSSRIDYLFSNSIREASPIMAGLVAMEEDEMTGEDNDEVVNAIIASPRSSSSRISGTDDDDNDDDDETLGAFNYISTQSKPKSSSTIHTLHNPSTVSHDILLGPPIHSSSQSSSMTIASLPLARTMDGGGSSNNNNNNNNYRSNNSSGFRNKCTVIQGHMSVYTTTSSESENSTYENLQGRILFAIAQSVNNSKDVLGIPNKKNPNGDGILAVRMHSDVPYANSNNSNNYGGGGGNVSSINSSAQETNNTNGLAFLSNIPMIPVLISMGILLLVVLALFISTSRPSKRQRRSNDDAAGNTKEETATIMSAKTIDIDLDAGEEVELQSTASSAFSLRGVEVDDDYYDENMQNGGGTTNRTPSHKSSKKGITPKRNRSIGGIGAVVTNGLRRNVSPRRQRSSESDGGDGIGGAGGGPSTPNSLMYSSASLPSPTQRTPVRSKKTSTMAKTDASTPPTGVSTIQSTPQRTPKPTLRSVPRTPRAITPDVEVELYDCLFPNSPGGAISCQSRNSLLGTPSSSARRGQQQQQQQQTKTQTRSTYLDMLATTFCSNPQNYDDVEVCLRPVDDCTECVENEFCSPLPTTITPCSMNKNKVVQVKEKERSTKNVVVPSKAVPNYVFANEDNDDGGNGGVGSTTMNRDDRITSQVNIIPNYVFAEKDGGDSGIKSKQERMKKSNAKVARKEEKESNGGIFRETFESKFGDPCGGGGRFLKRGRDRPDIDADISIAEIREIYSYDDDKYRRRGSARKKDPPAKKEEHVAEVSSTDGCVTGYNPTTACNDNWFFDWW